MQASVSSNVLPCIKIAEMAADKFLDGLLASKHKGSNFACEPVARRRHDRDPFNHGKKKRRERYGEISFVDKGGRDE